MTRQPHHPDHGPETTIDDFPRLLGRAREHAEVYIAGVRDRPVFPPAGALERLAAFDEALPAGPCPPEEVLDLLHGTGSPATVAQTGGRYFGFVNGGVLPVGLAARWLADTWDQNAAHYVMSPVASRLEAVCERWIVDLLGLPEGTAAGFLSGTTMASFSGLCAGRNELLRRQGWDVAAKGLYGAPPVRVVAGAHTHASVFKALSLLGMGVDGVETAPVDEQGAIAIEHLPELTATTLVITQAGNVNSGAFDPIDVICDRARAVGAWVHVDGAFGLWAAAAPSTRALCAGIEKADSWSADAHKTLNVPYDSGVLLCRDREALTRAFEASAAYFQWTDQREGMRYTPSMSRRARGIELWAVLKRLGRSGVEDLVERLCRHARRFAEGLAGADFRIHNDVVFNQVLVSCERDAITERTLGHLQDGGVCWCGGSTWHGTPVIRISVCDWSTTADDVDRSIDAFIAARAAARSQEPRP